MTLGRGGRYGIPLSQRFVVEGGQPLRGVVRPAGNKNAALPLLAATLLGDTPSEVSNVPRIRDVEVLLELLCARMLLPGAVPTDAAADERASPPQSSCSPPSRT